jgi:hypothetical protein
MMCCTVVTGIWNGCGCCYGVGRGPKHGVKGLASGPETLQVALAGCLHAPGPGKRPQHWGLKRPIRGFLSHVIRISGDEARPPSVWAPWVGGVARIWLSPPALLPPISQPSHL